jgi:hypothetical protein
MIIRNLKLKQWAALSEIIASLAVVISLVFVVISLERNTREMSAANINDLYDSLREIELAVAMDAEFTEVVRRVVSGHYDDLSEQEAYRYSFYALQHLSIWEQMHARYLDGSISSASYESWREYFRVFTRQSLPESLWRERRDWFNSPGFQSEVDALMGPE